jgi:plasmid replication initiation protein
MNLDNKPQNEDDVLMIAILFQLEKMRQNQKEFKTAIIDFIEDMIDNVKPDNN